MSYSQLQKLNQHNHEIQDIEMSKKENYSFASNYSSCNTSNAPKEIL